MIDVLIELLRRTGMDLTADEIADMIWLAVQRQRASRQDARLQDQEPPEGAEARVRAPLPNLPAPVPTLPPVPAPLQTPVYLPPTRSEGDAPDMPRGLPLKVPTAPALRS